MSSTELNEDKELNKEQSNDTQEEIKNKSVNQPKGREIILELQLGDVIKITNPKNDILNENTFIIDYIDKSKTYLINIDTLERIKLKISENGILGDGNITKIGIISRADSPSYAKQNNLLPNTWINIYFGGDFPVIITAEITNLEEDMIEIKTIDGDILYINFDYKGIPEDLPIENIEIRPKPSEPISKEQEPQEEEQQEQEPQEQEPQEEHIPEMEKDKEKVKTEQIKIGVQTKDIKDQIREFVIRADQIKFEDEILGPIVQYMDVSSKLQRYSIETQVSDLLDEILSTIPNIQRTPRVLNNIHIMIERFKQLREKFSYFDQYGNIEGAIVKESTYKPLMEYFNKFKINLYWILPVVKNIKKVYNVNEFGDENTDIIEIDLGKNLLDINELINNYKSNNLPSEQNKYSSLYSELNPYFTPFELIGDENMNSIIIEKEVMSNINVIIDNLENMYSSIFTNNNIKNRRFVIQKYNLGDTKLDTIDNTSSRMVTIRVPINKNDIMSIKSIVTLPETTIRFSKINLPGTSILDKSNLNLFFLNYWELLKQKSTINNHFIDNFDSTIELNENNFVNSIKNYVLNLSDESIGNMSKQEIYSNFINTIVPKTRTIFNLMKKYIIGKLSIIDVVSYLEPFLIYSDDLTYMQYVEIVNFISDKISEYNKSIIEKSRLFKIISSIDSAKIVSTKAFSVINMIKNDLYSNVFIESYEFFDPEKTFTNSEILKKIIQKDCAKLYTTAIALESLPLMFPSEFSTLFEEEKKYKDEKKKKGEEDSCKTITIAKYYTSIESLESDNNRMIYFDKKYDKTNYGLLNDYEKEIIKMTPEELTIYIKNDLMKKYNLTEIDADYLANTLLDGHKKVLDGQFAILYKGYNEKISDEVDYYVRKNNKWEINTELSSEDINTNESGILCDLQSQCINIPNKLLDDKCTNIKIYELGLQTKLLKDVINEFDEKYKETKENFEKKIQTKFNYLSSIIQIISKIETNQMLKYNNEKFRISSTIENENILSVISPYSKILDLILSQKDFIKKQNDIIRFVNTYTRPSLEMFNDLGFKETTHWLYCNKTSVPLLPTFKFDLASTFIKSEDLYCDLLETLKSTIGKQSDDGDCFVDKYSGWIICKIDYDNDEGYEDGFKKSSRSVIEMDAGSKIIATSSKNPIYNTPETKMIDNIIRALSFAMGINIESQKEFIMNNVLLSMQQTVENESDYKNQIKEMAEKGKKIPSYKDFYNTAILYYTFGLFLIAVQTAIPSIKTRKTHPGCIMSFSGYPFEGAGDLSSLSYLSCVAYDIRESGEPWNVLKGKKQEIIMNKIKNSLDNVILNLPNINRKFEEKTNYLLTNTTEKIPEEHDISKWVHFLPPLISFKIKHLVNVSNEFKKSLINDLKNGSIYQRDKILVIESKIMQFSLAIQEKIQEYVKNQKLLLHTSGNVPYLENACCESEENESTIDYFMKHKSSIKEYNQIINDLKNMTEDIISYSKASILYSNINTKNKYPSIQQTFDEKTIYLSFIYFCKFKSIMPIPTDLIPICTNKPENILFNLSDASLEQIIIKLKNDGRNYTNEQFLRLLQIIGRNNIIHMNINDNKNSQITKLSELLNRMDDENEEFVENSLRKLIKNTLDTFDIANEESTKEIKDLNNFLIKNIEIMKEEIVDFIQSNTGKNVTRRSIIEMKNSIENLSFWKTDDSNRNEEIKISDDKTYNIINFYKSFITNFAIIFPNIILNKVDYNDIHIPDYYGFSKNHSFKLKKNINDYYEKMKTFYGTFKLNTILSTVQKISKNLLLLSKYTPCFTNIKIEDKIIKPIFDERTSRFLYEYYLLKVMICYIELSDDEDMLINEITSSNETNEITDIFTTEYIEELDTRVDLSITSEKTVTLLNGNKRELKQNISQLLIVFIEILSTQKNMINISYEDIQDRIFKLKEKEKNIVTDRLKNITDEERNVDTILKINKLGMYSKGLQKGLTTLDKDFYDEEQKFRDEMTKAERNIRKNNKDATDENIDILLDDYMNEKQTELDIENDAYDMKHMGETYWDGNTDGIDAPEEEYSDYEEEY